MNTDNHIILNYLDSPLKIILWSRGELLSYITPFLIGLCFSQTILGLTISLINFAIYKRIKRGFLEWWDGAIYWYFPRGHLFYGFPPSYIRQMVG